MDPDDIKLETLEKIFKYEKLSREIENCNNIEKLKDISKSFVKLYLKQEETIANVLKHNGQTL